MPAIIQASLKVLTLMCNDEPTGSKKTKIYIFVNFSEF